MVSESVVIALSAVLLSGQPASFDDAKVSRMFEMDAMRRPIGASTAWVDVTQKVGHVHSVWLVKTAANRWEMRGAM